MVDETPRGWRPGGALGAILGASRATATKRPKEAATAAATRCPACGAARPERTDLRRCDYCGHRFMSDEAEL